MAGAKKKKAKPVANPARGFATTSIASKQVARVEDPDDPSSNADRASKSAAPPPHGADLPATAQTTSSSKAAQAKTEALSPEEFEKQLEESELQLLVEKHAQKVKKDAQRQRSRLETDRRLLRPQAEPINIKKWLPQELMDEILDLVQAESRFSTSSTGTESLNNAKLLPEEDLTIKLWTLQHVLEGVAFPMPKVDAVLRYVLEIGPHVSGSNRESIWGLEEALDWLARECDKEELPDYEQKNKIVAKSAIGETWPAY